MNGGAIPAGIVKRAMLTNLDLMAICLYMARSVSIVKKTMVNRFTFIEMWKSSNE